MIKIPKTIIEKIYQQARDEAPIEACGYLAGKDGLVEIIYPLHNVDQSTDHFSFDPKDQFKVVKEARAAGLQLIACYHSHPETPARPSEEDIKLAYDPNISYVIASIADGSEDIKSFRIASGQVKTENIEIISSAI